MSEVVLYEKKGPVGWITLNRPDKVNCMNGDMYERLHEIVEDYAADRNLRCAVVTGAGGNFSSGGDIKWLKEKREAAKASGKKYRYDYPVYRAMDRLAKPVVAAIDGHCLGSGLNLAMLFCDIRIASSRAKFAQPAAQRGFNQAGNDDLYPTPYTWYMGLGDVLYMMITGKTFTAAEALSMRMVNEVVEPERLLARAGEMAELICKASPQVIGLHKMMHKRYQEAPGSFARLHELIFRGATDEEYLEGAAAFLDKREPGWKPGQ